MSLIMGCASLPSQEGRTVTTALTETGTTRLGQAAGPLIAAHPGKSGIHPLSDPRDAFAARVLLAAAADKSLDVQYYIWHGDQTGFLLFEALWQAAERGVRVRLLLDDNGIIGLDDVIATLDAHRNIEVRLYNPFTLRSARALNFITDFGRLNRRMHNKSFTADNQASIVGGRNVGNEYYAAGSGVWFQDLDALAVGPVVREVSGAFDLYWNSASAYPVSSIVGAATPGGAAALAVKFEETRGDPVSASYIQVLRDTPFLRQLLAGTLSFEWTKARVLRDDPEKTLDASGRTDLLLLSSLLEAIGRPERSVDLVSPYFVPGEGGTAALVTLVQRGVKVRVLTNSLAATDVGMVHAGYAKRRHDLLRAGVTLYELKPSLQQDGDERSEKRILGGSSAASLHAKTFAIDGTRIFVGSFNFDQRSANLNTEMGLLVDSPELAGRLARSFDREVPAGAYEVRIDHDGSLEWVEHAPSGEKRYTSEPGVGPIRRGVVNFLSVFPIDWLL